MAMSLTRNHVHYYAQRVEEARDEADQPDLWGNTVDLDQAIEGLRRCIARARQVWPDVNDWLMQALEAHGIDPADHTTDQKDQENA